VNGSGESVLTNRNLVDKFSRIFPWAPAGNPRGLHLQAHVVFKLAVHGIEGFPDGDGESCASLAVDRNLGAWKGEIDTDPDSTAQIMLARSIHGDSTSFHSAVEVGQFLSPLPNVLGEVPGQ
jgi:hypothetical protein